MLDRRKKNLVLCILVVLWSARAGAQVLLGIDVLQREHFAPLLGKRVGLITNQTGVNSDGVKTRYILARAPGVDLVALFTPEHGLDGAEPAGHYVSSRRDRLTGRMAWSLYGPTRKPTPEMLDGIDTLVYDMQDIGCRSYTYISTLINCMDAAGEKGIDVVVLDRPNPLGGIRIEGPGMEDRWRSFVGPLPVPYVHGMTAGELARMADACGWVQPRCHLTVIQMRGWSRQMSWEDTGLRWVQPSPNIPYQTSPLYYVATGMIGELAGMETGVGSSEPFEVAAANHASYSRVMAEMERLRPDGVSFEPYVEGGFGGVRLHIQPHSEANLTGLGIYLLAGLNAGRDPNLFDISDGDKLQMFFKCYGSGSIRDYFDRGVSPGRIVASWAGGVSRFEWERRPYLLY
ncbi:MAG: DUF1343 domain-containing protein [Chthoniobacteraceae bacterium]|jgi:uncharacterized protein YbbC (DUF1343 family)